MNSISDIKHAYYINLDSRTDRKEHVEEQMNIIGINAERFKAIRLPNGAIGCSMSHLKLLETAKANNFPHILIVEDDAIVTSQLQRTLNKMGYESLGPVATGQEAKRTIDTCSKPDYREKLAEELKELRDSELWQAGAAVRSLRPEKNAVEASMIN